jgi:hypothetical protein
LNSSFVALIIGGQTNGLDEYFYAEHPTLVKTLGATALTMALSQIAKRQTA